MTHPKSAEEILKELNLTPEDMAHYQIFDYVRYAMHTFAEVWLREFAGRIITGTDSAQATYVATSLRDQIIKEMKGETK